MFKKLFLLLALLVTISLSLSASQLDETLQILSEAAARSYVNPVVSAFGSDINSGWFHSVPHAVPAQWNFEVGVVGMGSFWGNAAETFSVTDNFQFTRDQAVYLTQDITLDANQKEALINQIMAQSFALSITGPTIIGPSYDATTGENSIEVHFDTQTVTYTYNSQTYQQQVPGNIVPLEVGGLLADFPALPMVAPQLTIGTLLGTNAVFRYMPSTQTVPEIGKVDYFGYGIQHNPAVWFDQTFPVDIAAAFYIQRLKVGTLMEANALTYGINVAKTFGAKLVHLTPYLGLTSESATMKFAYNYATGSTTPDVPENIRIKFDVEAQNTTKLTAGLSFRLAIVNFNLDYSFAKYPSATAGVMCNFSW